MMTAEKAKTTGNGATLSDASVLSWYVLKRLFQGHRLRKLLTERLTEPVHLNLLSALVAAFGTFRAKVDFDMIVRQQYAFPMLHAGDVARQMGFRRVSIIEFGVANGAGLINLCKLAKSVTKTTGVEFDIYGFDTGAGMPPAVDYRDHPEHFQQGDFPMDHGRLAAALPPFAQLIIGDVAETIPAFLDRLSPDVPVAFVSVDVDYYSSAKKSLDIFKAVPIKYLPSVTLYLDDVGFETANPWCGELLAVREFNEEGALRKISPFAMLRVRRLFKNPLWIEQIYSVHILDHPVRHAGLKRASPSMIANEYLGP